MYNAKKILAFIGARAGSKGFKDKNIADFAGKPLIHWTIQAAKESRHIDRVIVSTDGEEIAKIAQEAGADVPFLRPADLARDESAIDDALRHGLQWLKSHDNDSYDYLVLLQPTSPLRTSRHIDQAIEQYFQNKKTDKDTLVSVYAASQKMGWLMEVKSSGYIDFCLDAMKNDKECRRQNLREYYLPNGAIYIASVKTLLDSGFYSGHAIAFIMAPNESIDIDTLEDFQISLDFFKKANDLSKV